MTEYIAAGFNILFYVVGFTVTVVWCVNGIQQDWQKWKARWRP